MIIMVKEFFETLLFILALILLVKECYEFGKILSIWFETMGK